MARARNALRGVDQVIQSCRQMVMAKILVPARCVSTNAVWVLEMLDQEHSCASMTLAQARNFALDAYNDLSYTDKASFRVIEGPDVQRCLNIPLPPRDSARAEIIQTRDLLYRTRDAWWREANYRGAKKRLPSNIRRAEPMIRDRIMYHDRLVRRWIQDRQHKELETKIAFDAMSTTNQRFFREWYGDLLSMVRMEV